MPINHEVFVPGIKSKTDPKEAVPKSPGLWEEKAKEAEAQKKYELARQELNEIKNPNPKTVAEPAFQVTGRVNLGDFDMQAQQKETQVRMKEIEEKYENQVAQINQQADNYREQVHQLQIKMIQDQFALQLENLSKQIGSGVSQKQPSFIEQMAQIQELSKVLGYEKPMPGIQDANLQIQMMKMQNDAAREAREFEWKMKQYDLEREMRLQEIREKSIIDLERVKLERDRNNMLASLPETIGGAIARGLLDSGNGAGNVVSNRPAPSQKTNSQKPYRVEAGEGQGGELPCPGCGAPIAILPTTEVAVCAKCGTRLPVVRVPVSQQAGQELSEEEAERAG
ncbi:MAG: hypothetical protein PHN44_00630 [Candidatus Marinimicrobia bacterium]|nr:hypothetical protein [Candidatus Neomarinimicrobiota bacterium]MDD5539129.1 hypothetical protein [Candidatus Neomarinimicrobiota bacterium]